MNVFNINVRFDNPTEIKALMKAEDAERMRAILMKVFDEVKNLEIVSIDDLGSIETFDFEEFQKEQERVNDLATVQPANKGFVI